MKSFQPNATIDAGKWLPTLFLLPVLLAFATPGQSDSAGMSHMSGLQAANFHDAASRRSGFQTAIFQGNDSARGRTSYDDLSPISRRSGFQTAIFSGNDSARGRTSYDDLSPISRRSGFQTAIFQGNDSARGRTSYDDLSPISRRSGLQAANFQGAPVARPAPIGCEKCGLAMLDPANGLASFWNPAVITAGGLATSVVSAGKWSSGIVASTSNRPPEITSVPILAVRVGKRYEYQVDAVDPDGDELSFSLANAPKRITIDESIGLIAWEPAAPPGEYPVELVVRDPDGAEASQAWTLLVLRPNEDNHAPQIVSEPPLNATLDQPWAYQIVAADPDDDIEGFELVTGSDTQGDGAPVGMRIDSGTGRVEWTPAETGEFPVTVAVVDEGGLRAEQSFTLTVSSTPGTIPPEWQSPAMLTAPLGRTTRFQLVAFDPDGEDLNYFVEPLPLPDGFKMNSLTGELEITPGLDQVGEHVLQMAASDGRFRIYQDFTVTVPAPDGPTRLRGRV
ncbi:MAG: putative Ig domain-containing protein, partial [Wenzhouxiangellaceae bacterium]|nr:putative Ig domain-containing protein [Wenzhouxiangellaceae bacterium]